MKIQKLTDNKIRIILNIEDLEKKNIDIHSLIKNPSGTQIFFQKILKQAQKEVGFDTQDSKLLIEAFISADGFFILTFTKLENKPQKVKRPSSKTKHKILHSPSNTAIYEFNNFDEFCNFCTYINNSKINNLKKFAKKISLYEYNSKYFLAFYEINTSFEHGSLFYVLISEFARLSSTSPFFYSKLSEYGNPIFKSNAIDRGIKLFSEA